jgi:hopanoid biosynthesis associated RND transporter like protein HpnN
MKSSMFSQMQLFRALMGLIATFVFRHFRTILIVAAVLTLLSGWLTATRLGVLNSVGALIREDSPVNQNYLAYKKEFHVEEEYVVVIRSSDPEKNREVAREVGERLRALKPDIARVLYRLDFSGMKPRSLLFLSEKELKGVEEQVGGYAEALTAQQVKLDLNSVLDQALARFDEKYLRKKSNWAEFKPFIDQFIVILNRLADQIEGKARSPKPAAVAGAQDPLADMAKQVEENEYLAFEEGTLVLVLATPGQIEKDSLSPFTETVKKIRAILKEVEVRHPGVSLGLTGEPVLNDDELQTSTRDSMVATVLTFVLICILFFFSYQELLRPCFALVSLLTATVISLGFTVISVGHLNIISQAMVVMILGLGIDFGVQIMGRYEEELARGRSVKDALAEAFQHTGMSIIVGGLTTSAAFYTMCFNDFIGLSELGVIAGTGILICLAVNLLVLPAIFVWRDRSRPTEELTAQARSSHWSYGPWLNETVFKYPRVILLGALCLTFLSAWGIPRIRFDYNLLNLQNPKMESVRTELELLKSPANSVIFGVVLADNLEEARQKVAVLKKLDSVMQVRSLTDLLPEEEEAKLKIVQRIVGKLKGLKLDTDVRGQVDVAKARRNIASLLAQSREAEQQAKKYTGISQQARDAVEVFSKLIPPLERAQAAMANLSQEEVGLRMNRYQVEVFGTLQRNLAMLRDQQADRGIRLEDLPPELLQRYRSASGKIMIEVYPKKNIWEREANKEFVRDLRSIDPNATGTPIQNYAYVEMLRTSYVEAAGWAFLVIVLLIALYFQDLRLGLLAILPLGLAILWTLGLMGLTGLQFNPANIITLPLVIGIGVAYGIYTVDRYREDRAMDLFSSSTGKSIVLSAGTTIIGFGSLMISSYRGLSSLGMLMTLGIFLCLVSSIIVLPQILKATKK